VSRPDSCNNTQMPRLPRYPDTNGENEEKIGLRRYCSDYVIIRGMDRSRVTRQI